MSVKRFKHTFVFQCYIISIINIPPSVSHKLSLGMGIKWLDPVFTFYFEKCNEVNKSPVNNIKPGNQLISFLGAQIEVLI